MEMTPSMDGHFDRISTQIDETFGSEAEFRRVCHMAAAHGSIVIDDIVPGHTGKVLTSGWRDEGRGLSRHLPHGGDPTRGLAPIA